MLDRSRENAFTDHGVAAMESYDKRRLIFIKKPG